MTEAEVYYNPEQQNVNKKDFSIKKHELLHILIAWVGITFAFSFAYILSKDYTYIFAVLLGTLTGFIGHELAHKFAAIHYGMHARFFLWPIGLGFAIIMSLISQGKYVFAAPGAVYIWGQDITKKQNGIISIAGPASNYIFAIVFIIAGIGLAISQVSIMIITIMIVVAKINLFLGGFNLLPIPPLDGFKIFMWDKYLWIVSLLIFIGTYILLLNI